MGASAAEDGDPPAIRIVDISAVRIADVLRDPHRAESLLQSIEPPPPYPYSSSPLLFAPRWPQHVEPAVHSDDLAFVIVPALELLASSLFALANVSASNLLELKNKNMNLRAELWRDPLIKSTG